VEKLGPPPIRLHDLRHCAATLSLAAGIRMKTIQALLGHSSYKLMADTYTSVLPQLEQEAADAPVAIVPRRSQESAESPQGPEAVPQAEPAEVPAVPDSDAEAPTGPAVLGLVPAEAAA
jgi:hypothetical protein